MERIEISEGLFIGANYYSKDTINTLKEIIRSNSSPPDDPLEGIFYFEAPSFGSMSIEAVTKLVNALQAVVEFYRSNGVDVINWKLLEE